ALLGGLDLLADAGGLAHGRSHDAGDLVVVAFDLAEDVAKVVVGIAVALLLGHGRSVSGIARSGWLVISGASHVAASFPCSIRARASARRCSIGAERSGTSHAASRGLVKPHLRAMEIRIASGKKRR